MKTNFPKALALVLQSEGGYSNNPNDPGGPTMKGVTQVTYNAHRARNGLALQTVQLISGAEISDIYKSEYWDALNADNLPNGVDYETFDFGVNSGIHRAATLLQSILGVTADGAIGPATIAAARVDTPAVIQRLEGARVAFQQHLATWGVFGRGWSNRDTSVENAAEQMA
jgi:lysozyme family protein